MTKVQKESNANGWTEKLESQLEGMGEITNDQCKELAATPEFEGKSAAAIRGKAVTMGIYKKAEATAKSTRTRPQKSQLVDAVGTLLSAPEGTLDSLEKANYQALEFISEALIKLSDSRDADSK